MLEEAARTAKKRVLAQASAFSGRRTSMSGGNYASQRKPSFTKILNGYDSQPITSAEAKGPEMKAAAGHGALDSFLNT